MAISRIIDHLQLAKFINTTVQDAHNKGVEVQLSTDFEDLKATCCKLPNKDPLSALFSPDFYEIGPADGFWIKGLNAGGDVVHTQAMRRDNLQGTRLDLRLKQALTRIYCRPGFGTARLSDLPWAPDIDRITGTVCYHGEIWLQTGKSGFRGKGLSSILPRLALGIALAKWDPDYIYGFTNPKLVRKGIAAQYGYMHAQPCGVFWDSPPDSICADDWIAWMSRSDLIYLTQLLP